MCGIAGIFHFDLNRTVDSVLLKTMGNSLLHRGPDDSGMVIDGSAGLVHRRLSIVDRSGGHQPMFNEDRSIAVVFNGEIYNYKELRQDLINRGHAFQTNSDTETIVHLYEEEGANFVSKLRGMFAIAIWDSPRKQLLLARDRLGKKPVFYSTSKDRLVFASEIKAILEVPDLERKIDYEGMVEYFTYMYIRAPRTAFYGINKLLPGHILICTPWNVSIQEYWDLPHEQNAKDLGESYYKDRLFELLEEAVKIRLIGEVPIGAFLSGGIDSSAVVGTMAKITTTPVITCSVGFSETQHDELDYARKFARDIGSDHFEAVAKPESISNLLSKLIWHFDEPFGDSSAIPTYYVSKEARKRVTVALSGDGGDENFAGYRNYRVDKLERGVRAHLPLSRQVCSRLLKLYSESGAPSRYLRGQKFLQNVSMSHIEAYHNTRSIISQNTRDNLFSIPFKSSIQKYDPSESFRAYYYAARALDPLSRLLYVDFKTYLADDILVKVDRMSMANSLEVRCPLLDHKFVEFAATIPAHYKLHGLSGKYIFKKAIKRIVPEEILSRQKQGFHIPLASWLRSGEVNKFAADIIFSNSLRERGYFNMNFVESMWVAHQKGSQYFATTLWLLIVFELWHRLFIDREIIL